MLYPAQNVTITSHSSFMYFWGAFTPLWIRQLERGTGNWETDKGNDIQWIAARGMELGTAAARTTVSVYGMPAQPIELLVPDHSYFKAFMCFVHKSFTGHTWFPSKDGLLSLCGKKTEGNRCLILFSHAVVSSYNWHSKQPKLLKTGNHCCFTVSPKLVWTLTGLTGGRKLAFLTLSDNGT